MAMMKPARGDSPFAVSQLGRGCLVPFTQRLCKHFLGCINGKGRCMRDLPMSRAGPGEEFSLAVTYRLQGLEHSGGAGYWSADEGLSTRNGIIFLIADIALGWDRNASMIKKKKKMGRDRARTIVRIESVAFQFPHFTDSCSGGAFGSRGHGLCSRCLKPHVERGFGWVVVVSGLLSLSGLLGLLSFSGLLPFLWLLSFSGLFVCCPFLVC